MVYGRGNTNNAIMDMLRYIAARLEAIEKLKRRGVHLEYVSDEKEETPNPKPKFEVEKYKESNLRFLSRVNARPTIEVSCYDGILETNFVMDWIYEMDK